MEKINFTNGKAPAINGTNLNQIQTNTENAINELAQPKIKKLWENPDQFTIFNAQNITLSSNDYDYLIVTYKFYRTYQDDNIHHLSQFIPKGFAFKLIDVGNYGISGNYENSACYSRGGVMVNDTEINFLKCEIFLSASPYYVSENNGYLIPLAIYGGKF